MFISQNLFSKSYFCYNNHFIFKIFKDDLNFFIIFNDCYLTKFFSKLRFYDGNNPRFINYYLAVNFYNRVANRLFL